MIQRWIGRVKHGPRLALTDGGSDGLASLRNIISKAAPHLNPGALLAVEHGNRRGGACGIFTETALKRW